MKCLFFFNSRFTELLTLRWPSVWILVWMAVVVYSCGPVMDWWTVQGVTTALVQRTLPLALSTCGAKKGWAIKDRTYFKQESVEISVQKCCLGRSGFLKLPTNATSDFSSAQFFINKQVIKNKREFDPAVGRLPRVPEWVSWIHFKVSLCLTNKKYYACWKQWKPYLFIYLFIWSFFW